VPGAQHEYGVLFVCGLTTVTEGTTSQRARQVDTNLHSPNTIEPFLAYGLRHALSLRCTPSTVTPDADRLWYTRASWTEYSCVATCEPTEGGCHITGRWYEIPRRYVTILRQCEGHRMFL
jgi:hypothetical protein